MFFSFVFVLSSYAQDKDKAVLLKSVFEKISKQHNVTFNYIEEEIAIFTITPPDLKLSLQQKLNYITKSTKLQFKFISDNYISIVNNKNLDKPICGFIIDSETNLPIESATITIKNENYSVISNIKGYFELAVRSPNDIEITHVNYEKRVVSPVELYQENCPNIKIKSIEYQLDEVTTQVILTKGISKKVDGSFEIKPKKFGLLPGLTEPDVFQTMLQLPGIMSVDETISNINVRGGTHDQNLFLWNGIRLFQTGHFYGLISVLNPNLAQKINVSKNGSSAFLSESVSSVVAITTNSDLSLNSNSIGINMINADFNTTLKPSKKSNLEFSVRRSLTDIWASPTYKNYFNRIFQNTVVSNLNNTESIEYQTDEKFYFYDATLKFQQKIKEKSTIILNLITISNQLDNNQSKIENGLTIKRESSLSQQTYAGSLEFNTAWNEKNNSKIIVNGSFYKVNSENQAIEGNLIFNQENDILDTNIQLKNSHILSSKVTFNNGYQFNEIGIKNLDRVNSPLFSRTIKDVLHIHALIGELNYNSENKKLSTTFGIRQNYISQFQKFITEPRLQLNYAFSPVFQLQLLAEIKNQTSSQIVDLQQDFLGIEKRRWTLSNNDDVPILKSNQVSLGCTFKKNNWLLTIDNFYKKVTGVSSRSQSFQNQLEFLKINGEYIVFGSEILIQKQISNITTWFTYSFTDNNYNFPDFSPSKFPNNFEIKHQINSGIIYDYKKLKMAFGGKWFTGKPFTLPKNETLVNGEIAYESPNSSRLEDYFQLNFSLGYSIELSKNSNLQFGASIQNILDSKNSINQYYRINQNTTQIEQINTYSLCRTPNSYLRFNF